ncbi:photosynthetic reaction center subunit M [Tranquillimonas alkanivorans]|uniref:Reaction center protein M chain n=1 Tax=Tranquillimonas alkanivorans TaxID=441119 RepID=A0A1I5MYQ1_9RHOB|nr:photosynthetic reaction center subunit M [Tranquillimonas alkanivorans]SFP14527.1 photosynthetic reaction center M subunit [Tranquillimonas alkanivorans]
MSRFHSLYTQIQIRGPADRPIPVPGRDRNGIFGPFFSIWLGRIGDPQIGRSYLGWWGWIAIVTGSISIMIMGFNFWAQADWNTVAFIRGMAWHRLDPPTGDGLYLRPLNQGGWWQWAGLLLTISILAWWMRIYTRAKALGMGTHVSWAFASAIWLYLCIGVLRPLIVGSWEEAPPFGIIPHLNWTATFSVLYGNFYYNPFHCFSIVFLYGSVLLWAMHGGTILGVARFGGEREAEEIVDRGTSQERGALFWRWTMGFNANFESIHRWIYWFAILTGVTGGIGILLTGTVVDNWYLWGVKWGLAPSYPDVYPDMVIPDAINRTSLDP